MYVLRIKKTLPTTNIYVKKFAHTNKKKLGHVGSEQDISTFIFFLYTD
jgi:hypothetical protein